MGGPGIVVPGLLLLTVLQVGSSQGTRFEPGNRLQILCDAEPALCVTRTVAYDGRIELPRLGRVSVATRSPEAVEREIEKAVLAQGIGSLHVTVRRVFDPDEPAQILGQLSLPFSGRLKAPISLRDAVRSCHPLVDADLSQVSVTTADGRTDLVDLAKSSRQILPGDRVEIARLSGGGVVNVVGGVLNPTAVRYQRGLTVGEAVAQAGGLSPHGDPERVVLVREGESIPISLTADAGRILRAGETIRIELRADRRFVSIAGAIRKPGLLPYQPGMTLLQAVSAAGGVTRSDATAARLKRTVEGKPKVVTLSLSFMMEKRIPDPPLLPDDDVEILLTHPGARP